MDVFEYEAGTLVLDFVDASTGRVVWRGWAQDALDGAIDDQDRLEKKIDKAVARMIDLCPAGRPSRAEAQPQDRPQRPGANRRRSPPSPRDRPATAPGWTHRQFLPTNV